jgi:hypothetical protein
VPGIPTPSSDLTTGQNCSQQKIKGAGSSNVTEEDFLLLLRDWRSASVLMATFGLTRSNEQNAAEIAAALESLGFNQIDDQPDMLRQ